MMDVRRAQVSDVCCAGGVGYCAEPAGVFGLRSEGERRYGGLAASLSRRWREQALSLGNVGWRATRALLGGLAGLGEGGRSAPGAVQPSRAGASGLVLYTKIR